MPHILFSSLDSMHKAIRIDRKARPYGALMSFNGFIPIMAYADEDKKGSDFAIDRSWRLYALQVSPLHILSSVRKRLAEDAGRFSSFRRMLGEKLLQGEKTEGFDFELDMSDSGDAEIFVDGLYRKKGLKKCFCVGMEIRREKRGDLAMLNAFGKVDDGEVKMAHLGFIKVDALLAPGCDLGLFMENADF